MEKFKPNIWRLNPVTKLTKIISRGAGRNNKGRISIWHRSSVTRRFRVIDYRRRLRIPAHLIRIERDPNRSAPIALLFYFNGLLSYILAPANAKELVAPIKSQKFTPGVAGPIVAIPIGTFVHNIELHPGFGGQMIKVAGAKAQIIQKNRQGVTVKLPSSEIRRIDNTCYATCGSIEKNHMFKHVKTRAGQNRWIGRRPTVRGVAMNPIDHPHGGGEGKTSGGRPSCSPWGILTKGYTTRNSRKAFTNIIITRRNVKKTITK